jgi:hypothetical protein
MKKNIDTIKEENPDFNIYIFDNLIQANDLPFSHSLAGRSEEIANYMKNGITVLNNQMPRIATNGGEADFYSPIVLSAQDYYPFGMLMPGRSFSSEDYRFWFNGMEKDDEVKGIGNSLDF